MEDIDKKIKALKDREDSKVFDQNKKLYKSRMNQMREDTRIFYRYLYQLILGFHWVWINILNPMRKFFSNIGGRLFGYYRHVWALAVYKRDKYGDLAFSKTYAGLFLTATFAVFYMAYTMAGFVLDASIYLATKEKNEIIYLTNSQEIDPEGNVHSVQGCVSLPCDDNSSIYFRIAPTAFNHVWSVFHNHSVFYPDYISAAVPPGINKCVVTSYGVRVKFVMRGFDLYPYLLRVSCESFNK